MARSVHRGNSGGGGGDSGGGSSGGSGSGDHGEGGGFANTERGKSCPNDRGGGQGVAGEGKGVHTPVIPEAPATTPDSGQCVMGLSAAKSRGRGAELPGDAGGGGGGAMAGGSAWASKKKLQKMAVDGGDGDGGGGGGGVGGVGGRVGSAVGASGMRGKRDGSRIFCGRVFVVHGTGLEKEEEELAAQLVVRHGGRCLHPGETQGVSPLRQALRSAGVELDPATASTAAATAAASRNGENRADLRVRSRASSGASPSLRCVIVSKHGCCPWINATGEGSGDHGGNVEVDGDGDASVSGLSSSLSAVPGLPVTAAAAAASSPCHILGRDVREVLETEARAELVTMLWIESCHRAQELRQPSGCKDAFRPQAWPIVTFSEASRRAKIAASAAPSASAAATALRKDLGARGGGRGGGGKGGGAAAGGPAGRRFAVAVTGFVGAERAGLEQLIECMGAELCKSLKKRVTTHLVCKEAKGDKYERALQWGVPAVSTDWLLRCAQHGYETGTEEMHPPAKSLALASADAAAAAAATAAATAATAAAAAAATATAVSAGTIAATDATAVITPATAATAASASNTAFAATATAAAVADRLLEPSGAGGNGTDGPTENSPPPRLPPHLMGDARIGRPLAARGSAEAEDIGEFPSGVSSGGGGGGGDGGGGGGGGGSDVCGEGAESPAYSRTTQPTPAGAHAAGQGKGGGRADGGGGSRVACELFVASYEASEGPQRLPGPQDRRDVNTSPKPESAVAEVVAAAITEVCSTEIVVTAAVAVEAAAAPVPSPAASALPSTTTVVLSDACDPAHHLPAPAVGKASPLAQMPLDAIAAGRTPVRGGTPAVATASTAAAAAAAAASAATEDTDDPVLETSGLEQQLRSMLSAAAGNSGGSSGGSGGVGTAAGDLGGGIQPPRSRRRLRPSTWGARPAGRPLPRLPSQQEAGGLSAASETTASTPTPGSALGSTSTGSSSLGRSDQQQRGEEAVDDEEGEVEGGEDEREGRKRGRTEAADGMASRRGSLSDVGLSSRSKSPSRPLHPVGVGGEEEAIAFTDGEGEGGGGERENVLRPGRGGRAGAFYRSPGAENRSRRVKRGGGGGGALASLRNGHDSRRALGKSPGGERDGVAVEGVCSAGQENELPGSRDRAVYLHGKSKSTRRHQYRQGHPHQHPQHPQQQQQQQQAQYQQQYLGRHGRGCSPSLGAAEAGGRGGSGGGGGSGGDMEIGKALSKPGAVENHSDNDDDDDDGRHDDGHEQQHGLMEEESQIVTFGEQYNPATGWIR